MIKCKSAGKGQTLFTTSEGIQAMFLHAFNKANVYYQDKQIDTIDTFNMPVSVFAKCLESFVPSKINKSS